MTEIAEKNANRALLLLRLIDDDARTSVLAALPEKLRQELKNRIRATTMERLPSPRLVERLLTEFQQLFQCVRSVSQPRLKLVGGVQTETEDDVYPLSGNVRLDLENMNRLQLAAALNEEHPRTVALIMANLSTERVASLIQELAPAQRMAVAKEIVRTPRTLGIVFEKVAASALKRAATFPVEKQEEFNVILRMANIFREIDKSERRNLIESIREDNEEIAMEVQKAMYRFEDLLELDDRGVQAVLAQTDSTTLQNALFEATDEMIDKIMSNLSRRAAATLREELTYQRSVPEIQRKLAREAVALAIGTIEEESA